MNKQEALKILKDKLFYTEETSLEVRVDGVEIIKRGIVDDLALEAIKVLGKEEQTVAEILGWKEGDVYRHCNLYKLQDGVLMISLGDDEWRRSSYNDRDEDFEKNLNILKKKAVKVKGTAYYVKDEYSYNRLMKELEEKGYDMNFKNNPFVFDGEIYIFEEENKKLGFSIIKLNKVLRKYDLIEYHKEPKLKAWRITDEYSFNELKKELGYLFEYVSSCDNYIYERKLIDCSIIYSWTDNLKEIEDTHEIIKYKKEEPLYYAKIKGWELNSRDYLYWTYDKHNNNLFVSVHNLEGKDYQKIMTKEEWFELGINDSNADFEVVE